METRNFSVQSGAERMPSSRRTDMTDLLSYVESSSKRMYSLYWTDMTDLASYDNLDDENYDNDSVGDDGGWCYWTDDLDEIVQYCLKTNPNDLEKLTEWKNKILNQQKKKFFPVDLSKFGEPKQYYNYKTINDPKEPKGFLRLQHAAISISIVDLPDESKYVVDCHFSCNEETHALNECDCDSSRYGEPFYVHRKSVDSYVLK